ncbi:hypothetical protein AMTRI_Chr03g49070 [Amborella trichopoda]
MTFEYMGNTNGNIASLPPGFGFHPTDVELVSYYLKGKILGKNRDTIPEVDLYKHEPWDLPEKSDMPFRCSSWHFFCARGKKYPNGSRTNRATKAGFWKATGKDRNVKFRRRTIGTKKTLVFHAGRAPSGVRTDWLMHEYHLAKEECEAAAPGMKDAFVLCRVFKNDESGTSDDDGLEQNERHVAAQPTEGRSMNTPYGNSYDLVSDDLSIAMYLNSEAAFIPASGEYTSNQRVDPNPHILELNDGVASSPLRIEDFPEIPFNLGIGDQSTFFDHFSTSDPLSEHDIIEEIYDAITSASLSGPSSTLPGDHGFTPSAYSELYNPQVPDNVVDREEPEINVRYWPSGPESEIPGPRSRLQMHKMQNRSTNRAETYSYNKGAVGVLNGSGYSGSESSCDLQEQLLLLEEFNSGLGNESKEIPISEPSLAPLGCYQVSAIFCKDEEPNSDQLIREAHSYQTVTEMRDIFISDGSPFRKDSGSTVAKVKSRQKGRKARRPPKENVSLTKKQVKKIIGDSGGQSNVEGFHSVSQRSVLSSLGACIIGAMLLFVYAYFMLCKIRKFVTGLCILGL